MSSISTDYEMDQLEDRLSSLCLDLSTAINGKTESLMQETAERLNAIMCLVREFQQVHDKRRMNLRHIHLKMDQIFSRMEDCACGINRSALSIACDSESMESAMKCTNKQISLLSDAALNMMASDVDILLLGIDQCQVIINKLKLMLASSDWYHEDVQSTD